MPNWLTNLVFAIYPLSAVWELWKSTRLQRELKSNLIIDWGPQPRNVFPWVIFAMVALLAWFSAVSASPNRWLLLLAAAIGLHAIQGALETFRRLGIYKDGMLVLTGRFIRWSEIKTYRWEKQGRLIINPGWNPTICQISEERIADLEAVLNEKCLDAELAIQHVTP